MNETIEKPAGMIAGIVASLLAILGIFTLAILFIPLAIIVATFGTIRAIRRLSIASVGIQLIAWLLIIVGIFTSPTLMAAIASVLA